MLRILRLAALLSCVLCCSSSALAAGRGRVDVVRFPDDWTWFDPGGHEYLPVPIIYKVWRLPGAGGAELLFGAARRGDEGYLFGEYVGQEPRQEWSGAVPRALGKDYSEDFFAVSLGGGRPRVRKVSEPERLRGEPVLNGYHYISNYGQQINIFGVKNAPPGISYAGRHFARSGRFWAATVGMVSPGGKWLAVFSYTSRKEPRPLSGLILPTGGEPERGTIHADVYDAATGELVLSGRHSFGGDVPSSLLGDAVWVEDRYLAVPLDYHHRKCMLLTLPLNEDTA